MKKLSFALLSAVLFFASCEKKVTLPSNNNNATSPTTPSPAPTSGDGFIVAINTITNTTVAGFPVNTVFGTGVAGFGDLAGGAYNDAGTITLEGKTFTKNANNSYTFVPSVSDPTGIDLSGSLDWNVGGGNGIPAFTYDASVLGMPVTTDLNSFTTINSANDFTLGTTGTISNTDSVYFQIAGPTGTLLLKRMAANTNSVTFTAAELQTLGKGTGSVVIAPWKMTTTTQGGKTIYVINEVALSRVVDIQ